jgi:single-stranded-DNA-specific exonuclease
LSLPGGSFSYFDERAGSIAEVLLAIPPGEGVLIISHLDADGLSAGSIMLQALLRSGLSPQLRIVKQLDDEVVKEISQSKSRFIIFTDLGSGQKSLLKKIGERTLIVVDHHQPEQVETELLELNPHLSNFNGSTDLSAAGTAYLLAVKMDRGNKFMAPLAIVGALGDIQDKGERSTLIGINAKIVEEAEKDGELIVKKGLKLYGFESRPLVQCLAYTMEPYLPGLSGDEGACYKFIKNLGIEPRKADGSWRSQSDLSREELRVVINSMIKYLISQGLSSRDAESVVGALYIFTKEATDSPLRDAREFSSSINACGRLGRYGLGVSICLGDRGEVLNEFKEVLHEYRRIISEYLNWLSSDKEAIKILPHVQAIYGGTRVDEKMIGTLVSIAFSSKPFTMDRPIVGFAISSGITKVSARGTTDLVRRGLNLGMVMKEAAERFGGTGGGHNIAAGAQIPLGKEDEFLSFADSIVSKAMGGVRL